MRVISAFIATFSLARRYASVGTSYKERKCAENYTKWHNEFIFLNCSQHFNNFKP